MARKNGKQNQPEPNTLLLIAAVNYGSFLYDTDKLPIVRSGSWRALELPRRFGCDFSKIEGGEPFKLSPISLGGSTGVFSVSVAKTEVLPEIEKALLDHAEAVIAKLSGYEAVPIVCVTHTDESFPRCLAALRAKAAWQQMRMHTMRCPDDERLAHDTRDRHSVCSFTHVRPGDELDRGSQPPLPVARSVRSRLDHGRELSRQGKLYRAVAGDDIARENGLGVVRDFGELADVSAVAGDDVTDEASTHLAYLYFDGNDFGKLRAASEKTPAKLKKFDKEIGKYRSALLKKLLEEIDSVKSNSPLAPLDGTRGLHLVPLLWGGDESLLVVPARYGLLVMQSIVAIMRRSNGGKGWRMGGKDMTHAYGLLVAHHKTPVREARRMAQTLAELGKTRDRTRDSWTCAIMRSRDHVPFGDQEAAMARYFERRFGGSTGSARWLQGLRFPADAETADRLHQALRTIARVPRRQSRRIAAAVCDGALERASAFEERLKALLGGPAAFDTTSCALGTIGEVWLGPEDDFKGELAGKPIDNERRLAAWTLVEELHDLIPSADEESGR